MQITVKAIETEPAQEATRNSLVILGNARELVVRNQNEYETAGNFLQVIKGKFDELELKRKAITKPLDAAKKEVMDLFRPATEAILKAEDVAKTKMLAYIRDQENKRIAEERKLQAEADRKRKEAEKKAEEARAEGNETKAAKYETKAEQIVAPTLAPAVEKVAGIATRILWSAEVVDVAAIPREYMVPNQQALDKVAQATKGALKIPGVVFHSREILASGRR